MANFQYKNIKVTKRSSEVLVDNPRSIWISLKNEFLLIYDARQFLKFYRSKSRPAINEMQLRARLTYYVHKIEKGLSYVDIKPGFGKVPLKQLAETMRAYNNEQYDKKDKAYLNALSAIREYVTVHPSNSADVQYVKNIFLDIYGEAIESTSNLAGALRVLRESKLENGTKNFAELFIQRCSVRDYDSTPVDVSLIKDAIDIAAKTPSACNRQPCHVYCITDKEVIRKAQVIQISMASYETPPMLLLITSSYSSYLNLTERREPFIDGGMFAMSLLLALEYKQLATCLFNAMFNIDQEKAMRDLIGFQKSEVPIVLIAVGNFKATSKVPKSFRYSIDEIATFV